MATEEEEKLTSQTFSGKEVTESSPVAPADPVSSFLTGTSMALPLHLPQLPHPLCPSCQGWVFIYCCQDREGTSFVCHEHSNRGLDSNSSVFIPNPSLQTKTECGRRMGRVKIWWKSSSSQPVSQLETSFCFSLFRGRTIERVLLKTLLVHLCSVISH